MVSVTSKQNQQQAEQSMGETQQPLGANLNQESSAMDLASIFGGDLGSLADGSQGAKASTLIATLKEFMEKEKVSSAFQPTIITHQDLPNGEMVAIYVTQEDQAYLHPIIFAEQGGRTQQTQDTVNGLGGTVRESKVSSAAITRISGFKNILLEALQSKGNARIRDVNNIAICGCTLVHNGKELKPNNILANASNEIFAIYCAKNSLVNKHVRPVSTYVGSDLFIDSTAVADKTNIHGQHIFAPVTLTTTARVKSELENSTIQHNVPVGDVNGYMDFLPYSQEARQQEQMARNQRGIATRVPSHKPFYIITNESWAGYKGSQTTAENLATLLMVLPSIADGALWVPRVVNAGDSGFNPLYDFASVGYDEQDFNKPFEECHVPNKFPLAAQRKYASDYFDSVQICMDFAQSGPNSAAISLLTMPEQLNKIITNLTGVQANFTSLGQTLGRIPLGEYNFAGKKRDIRELLNYFSWAKFVNGDKMQLQRWHQWFGKFDPAHEERYFEERLKMANEISNETFELYDTAERIVVDADIINGIRKQFTAAKINIRTQAPNSDINVGYGFSGGFGGGMEQQQQQQNLGMGANIQTHDLW